MCWYLNFHFLCFRAVLFLHLNVFLLIDLMFSNFYDSNWKQTVFRIFNFENLWCVSIFDLNFYFNFNFKLFIVCFENLQFSEFLIFAKFFFLFFQTFHNHFSHSHWWKKIEKRGSATWQFDSIIQATASEKVKTTICHILLF